MEDYFYPGPTEVQYFWKNSWSKGIAYCDFIIDLYSGKPHLIDTVYRDAIKKGIDPDMAIIEKCEWINILEFLNA